MFETKGGKMTLKYNIELLKVKLEEAADAAEKILTEHGEEINDRENSNAMLAMISCRQIISFIERGERNEG